MKQSTSYGSLATYPSPSNRRIRPSASVPDFTQHASDSDVNNAHSLTSTSDSINNKSTTSPGTAPRNVRFTTNTSASTSNTATATATSSSPRLRSQLSHTYSNNSNGYASPGSFSPVPLTRVLSNGATPQNQTPVSKISPPRFPIARSPSSTLHQNQLSAISSSSSSSSSSTKNGTPIRSVSSNWTGNSISGQTVAPTTPTSTPAIASAGQTVESLLKRKPAPPMSRSEVAKRLRTNAVLLVLWWLSSRTQVYSYTSQHLSQFVPALSTPLNVFEKGLFILLCYNVADSMRSLNNLSPLSSSTSSSSSSSITTPGKSSSPHLRKSLPGTPHFSAPVQSSPKTRATCFTSPNSNNSATNGSPSPTRTFRASVMSSPQPPSPQTPASISRPSVSSALRNVYVAATPTRGSPSATLLQLDTPSKPDQEGVSSLKSSLSAYRARHEPLSPPKISVNSQETIDRMFEM